MCGLTVLLFLLNFASRILACEIRYSKVGCYKDSLKMRTFPNLVLNARYSGARNNPGYSIIWDMEKHQKFLPRFICDCAKAISSIGSHYFGIQYYAECWSGEAGPQDIEKLKSSTLCVNSTFEPCEAQTQQCSGTRLTNVIYHLYNQADHTTKKTNPEISTKPSTTKASSTTTESAPIKEPSKTTIQFSSTTTESTPKITHTSLTSIAPPTTTESSPTTTESSPTTTKSSIENNSPSTTPESKKATTKIPTRRRPLPTDIKSLFTTSKAPKTTTKFPFTSCMKNADILIALDVSSSISLAEFEKRKQLLANFVARFPVNEIEVHFALLHYNHFIHIDFTFENARFHSIVNVQDAIRQVALLGGATLTQKALVEALNVFTKPQYGRRPSSNKVLIIVTDGYTYGGEKTLELSSLKLQLAEVHIVPIGFGQRTNVAGLRMMSNSVLTFDNILQKTGDELIQYIDMLVRVVCQRPSEL